MPASRVAFRFRCFGERPATGSAAAMKPTSSRAVAVQTTVVFLPRPLSARAYRSMRSRLAYDERGHSLPW